MFISSLLSRRVTTPHLWYWLCFRSHDWVVEEKTLHRALSTVSKPAATWNIIGLLSSIETHKVNRLDRSTAWILKAIPCLSAVLGGRWTPISHAWILGPWPLASFLVGPCPDFRLTSRLVTGHLCRRLSNLSQYAVPLVEMESGRIFTGLLESHSA